MSARDGPMTRRCAWCETTTLRDDEPVTHGICSMCELEMEAEMEREDMRLSWDEMTTRERDALVAEKVMGWNVYQASWSPTTDIAAAWEVVEKMDAEHRTLRVSRHPVMGWECEIFPPYPWREHTNEGVRVHSTSYSASADTAPEAICLAALRARGVDV